MIEVQALSRAFHSREAAGFGGLRSKTRLVQAVDQVSFRAEDGQITGLLGPNGAGKTTTLRMLATLLKPDAGEAWIDGHALTREPEAVRRKLGVLGDAKGLYWRLTARENILYFARLLGLERAQAERRAERLLEQLGLAALADRPAEGFSQGERMKVAIARALIHDPQTILLDEPTNGLDIMATRAMRELIRSLREQGKCVLFSSHIMQEVAALCDRVVIIAHGRVVFDASREAIEREARGGSLEDAFIRLIGSGEGLAA